MRDGVKLFTLVYIPKDVFSDGKTYPILMQRTGYNVAPYGADLYHANLGLSELREREKVIFVYQDVRGRFMSEGDFVTIGPHKPVTKGPKDTDESTDTYDMIDWGGEASAGEHRQSRHVRHFAAGFCVTAGTAGVPMGGSQELIRGEPSRGKFRKSFEKADSVRTQPAPTASCFICPIYRP